VIALAGPDCPYALTGQPYAHPAKIVDQLGSMGARSIRTTVISLVVFAWYWS
jgi:hypothetical protein